MMKTIFQILTLAILLPSYSGAEEGDALKDQVGKELKTAAEELKQIEGKPGVQFFADEHGKIFIGKIELSDKQFSAMCSELALAFPDNPIHLKTPATIPHAHHRKIISISSKAGIKGVICKIGETSAKAKAERNKQ